MDYPYVGRFRYRRRSSRRIETLHSRCFASETLRLRKKRLKAKIVDKELRGLRSVLPPFYVFFLFNT